MDRDTFILTILSVQVGIVLIFFIASLIRSHRRKKNLQLQNNIESSKKIKEELDEQIKAKEVLDKELANARKEKEKAEVALQCARRQKKEEAKYKKAELERELTSYSNYLWEKEKQKRKERTDKYVEELQQLTDIYDSIAEQHKSEADFAAEEAMEIILALREEINDYRAQCDAINEQRRQEELLENEKESHIIHLSILEKEDIDRLLELSRTFNQKTVIYKLIWTAFLQKPFNDMINALFGNSVPRSVIYCIENQKSHKKYIGKTSAEVSKRWAEHIKTSLNIGTVSKQKIHEALYGNWNDFTFTVLEQVDKDKLSEREKFYIDLYQSNVYGYNLKKGG